MRIESLRIKNFKGIEDETFVFDGKNATVYGQNGSKKTTIADAWIYLCTDKDSLDQGDFQIKPIDPVTKEVQHHLVSTVDTSLDLGDGRQLELKKEFSEVWTRPRNCAEKMLTSHKTKYFINGGKDISKTCYQNRLAEIVTKEAFQLLTSPFFFSRGFHWQKRRDLVLKLCGGDIDESVIIASDPNLNALMVSLKAQGQTIEDCRQDIEQAQRDMNKEIDKILVQIAEAEHGRPDTSKLDSRECLAKALKDAFCFERKLQGEKWTTETGHGVAEKKKELAEVEAEIAICERDHANTVAGIVKEKRVELGRLCGEHSILFGVSEGIQRAIKECEDGVRDGEKLLKHLCEDFDAEKKSALELGLLCRECTQIIPPELQEQAKSSRLTNINECGKLKSKILEEDKTALAKLGKDLKANQDQVAIKNKEIEAMEEEIKKIQEAGPSTERHDLGKKARNFREALEFLAKGNTEAVYAAETKIVVAQDARRTIEEQLMAWERSGEKDVRIKELGSEQKTLAKEFDGLTQKLSVIDGYTRKRVALLQAKQDTINSRFELARFKMFELQVNGTTKDCCEVTDVKGVPFDGNLNGAARVQVGVDIIITLSKHYGVSLPLFIDNRESVTDLPPMECQVISLVVSPEDKSLRVVKEEVNELHEDKRLI